MIFHCEYCGASIDSDIDKKCPLCGASYGKNKSFKELKQKEEIRRRLEQEEKEAKLEKQRIQNEYNRTKFRNYQKNEQIKKSNRTGLTILLIFAMPVIFASLCSGIFLLGGVVSTINDYSTIEENKNYYEEIEEPTFTFDKNVGWINEPVSNGTLEVTLDKIEEFDNYPFKSPDGYIPVAIHFTVKNISDYEYFDESKVYLLADGILMEKEWLDDYKKLSDTKIPSGMKIDGYLGFEIPENVNNIEIKYGDYITISATGDDIIRLSENVD